MKLTEIKTALAEVERDVLMKAVTECYKAVPKNKRDELDSVIRSLSGRPDVDNGAKLDSLIGEINGFIDDAMDDCYIRPNRTVPKNERSRWRFKAAGYFKALLAFRPDHPDAEMIADTLCKLYGLMCHACCYIIFRTQDPFPAIGRSQPDLFAEIASFTFASVPGNDALFKKIIKLSLHDGVARDNLCCNQHFTLLYRGILKPDQWDRAADILGEIKAEYLQMYRRDRSIRDYTLMERHSNACEFLLSIDVLRGNAVEGYDRFDKDMSVFENNREIILYCALTSPFVRKSADAWMAIYRRAVSLKIKPRQSVVEEYQSLLVGGGKQ